MFLVTLSLLPANKVYEGYVFTCVCLSTGGGWYPSMPYRSPGQPPAGEVEESGWGMGVSRPTAGGGGKLRGLGRGVPRPTPRVNLRGLARGFSRPTHGGCIPACTETDPPLSKRLFMREACILHECIRVFAMNSYILFKNL